MTPRLTITLVALLLVGAACQPIVAPDDSFGVENAIQAETPAAMPELTDEPTEEPTDVGPKHPIVMGEAALEIREITSEALEGNLIGDPATRQFAVLLPPGYAEGAKRYPVVYVLHWYTGGPFVMPMEIKPEYEDLLHEGVVQEIIFVFPDGSNAFHGSVYMSSPTIGDYETYLTEELIDLVDKTYRTLPHRDSRGITGCSMGGDGSLRFVLKYPEIYGVAVPVGTQPDANPETDPLLTTVLDVLQFIPENLDQFDQLPWQAQTFFATAAAVASNPDTPPLYLDMPFEIVDGEARIVPEVFAKMMEADSMREAERHVLQPVRPNGLLLYVSDVDPLSPLDMMERLSQRMTELGIEHEVELYRRGHCQNDWAPVIEFLSDNLVGESP